MNPLRNNLLIRNLIGNSTEVKLKGSADAGVVTVKVDGKVHKTIPWDSFQRNGYEERINGFSIEILSKHQQFDRKQTALRKEISKLQGRITQLTSNFQGSFVRKSYKLPGFQFSYWHPTGILAGKDMSCTNPERNKKVGITSDIDKQVVSISIDDKHIENINLQVFLEEGYDKAINGERIQIKTDFLELTEKLTQLKAKLHFMQEPPEHEVYYKIFCNYSGVWKGKTTTSQRTSHDRDLLPSSC